VGGLFVRNRSKIGIATEGVHRGRRRGVGRTRGWSAGQLSRRLNHRGSMTDSDFLSAFSALLEGTVRDEDLRPPIHAVALASNGSLFALRWDEGQPAVVLAEHLEDDGLAMPIHFMAVDSTGRSAVFDFPSLRERPRRVY
jgi:hypothetical protein